LPHLNGAVDVYDVSLTVASCTGAYEYLNGQFEGLATFTASSYWDYDALLRTWLSKRDGSSSPAAVVTLGIPM
jgi:hypothetical protein